MKNYNAPWPFLRGNNSSHDNHKNTTEDETATSPLSMKAQTHNGVVTVNLTDSYRTDKYKTRTLPANRHNKYLGAFRLYIYYLYTYYTVTKYGRIQSLLVNSICTSQPLK